MDQNSQVKNSFDPMINSPKRAAGGIGSLLLRVAREVKEVSSFYGQELNRTMYNLARMNMILHSIHCSKFDLRQEDTLEHLQHRTDERFEAVVAAHFAWPFCRLIAFGESMAWKSVDRRALTTGFLPLSPYIEAAFKAAKFSAIQRFVNYINLCYY